MIDLSPPLTPLVCFPVQDGRHSRSGIGATLSSSHTDLTSQRSYSIMEMGAPPVGGLPSPAHTHDSFTSWGEYTIADHYMCMWSNKQTACAFVRSLHIRGSTSSTNACLVASESSRKSCASFMLSRQHARSGDGQQRSTQSPLRSDQRHHRARHSRCRRLPGWCVCFCHKMEEKGISSKHKNVVAYV